MNTTSALSAASCAGEAADFQSLRIGKKIMYLATTKSDGYSRVESISPFLEAGRLFAFLEPTSSKAKDLQRDGRFTLHSFVSNGELKIIGLAQLVQDPETRKRAAPFCPFPPKDRDALFHFQVDHCSVKPDRDSGNEPSHIHDRGDELFYILTGENGR